MPNCSLSGVVRGLRLWHVHDCTAHAANEHDATWGLALHEMLGHPDGEEVGAIDVDTPELLHAVVWVLDGVEVLGEAGGGDQMVDLAMVLDDLSKDRVDRLWVGDICVVSSDSGDLLSSRIFRAECVLQKFGLLSSLLLYRDMLAPLTAN
jgi:hypothetical protein